MKEQEEAKLKLKVIMRFVKKAKAKYEVDTTWDEIRYTILELYRYIELMVDGIILRRYIGDAESDRAVIIRADILAKIDFSRKIILLEELKEKSKLSVDIGTIRAVHNLRNALVHNFPKKHKYFLYKKGHIIDDGKLSGLLDAVFDLLEKLEKAEKEMTSLDESYVLRDFIDEADIAIQSENEDKTVN